MKAKDTVTPTPESEIAEYIIAAKNMQAEITCPVCYDEGKKAGYKEAERKYQSTERERYWTGVYRTLVEKSVKLREYYQKKLKGEHKAGAKEVVEWIEKSTSPMNTNMYGISLSRSKWQAQVKKWLEEVT